MLIGLVIACRVVGITYAVGMMFLASASSSVFP